VIADRRAVVALACALALGGSASAQSGAASHPILVHMKRGSDVARLTGVLRPRRDCCAYRFTASAGQSLHWRLAGPTVRVTLTYPDGHTDGPGLPDIALLPADGAYVFTVSPDLMADGAYGRFHLRLEIPRGR
jgi:hypothetical protein